VPEYTLLEAVYEVTRRCNLACRHCGSSAGAPRTGELSRIEALQLIRTLCDLGPALITLSGGEPFLSPHWAALGREIRDYGVQLAVITNGYAVGEDEVENLVALEPYEVAVSLDGGRVVHDANRGAGSFDHAVAAIRRLRARDLPVGVITTVTRANLGSLGNVLATILTCGVDAWQVQPAIPMGRMDAGAVLSAAEYQQLTATIHRLRETHGDQLLLSGADCAGIGAKELVTDILYEDGICTAGTSNVGIRSDGDVVGCLSMMHPNCVEGNVRDRDFRDIWLDPEAFVYNRIPAELSGRCADCPQSAACRAGCRSMNIAAGHAQESPYCALFPLGLIEI